MLVLDLKRSTQVKGKKNVKLTIENDGVTFKKSGINIIGGIIREYQGDSAFNIVTPFGFGECTSGMLLSQLQSMITVAIRNSMEAGVTPDLLRSVAHLAVDDAFKLEDSINKIISKDGLSN